MTPILHDVRYAVRSLSRSPGLVFAVVLSLALGIGANATIFSLVNAIALRPMPCQRPSELVSIYQSESDGEKWGAWSVPAYRELRDRARSVTALAGYTVVPVSLSDDAGGATRLFGAIATGNYFRTLGVHAGLGR